MSEKPRHRGEAGETHDQICARVFGDGFRVVPYGSRWLPPDHLIVGWVRDRDTRHFNASSERVIRDDGSFERWIRAQKVAAARRAIEDIEITTPEEKARVVCADAELAHVEAAILKEGPA